MSAAIAILPRWKKVSRRAKSTPPAIKLIRRCVAHYYGLTVEEIMCNSRATSIAWPRQVAIALCCELTYYGSLEATAAFNVHQRLHSHAVSKVRYRCKAYPLHKKELAELRTIILGYTDSEQPVRKKEYLLVGDTPTKRQNSERVKI